MASVFLIKSVLKVIMDWFNGFNVTAKPKEKGLFTSHQVNVEKSLSPGESISHLHEFWEGAGTS